ncbi:MAG: GTP 3',8-cyclase MoaA [Firmicutes bacterium]|nr:GTP 3',8-cyclase MoaA [Bacillota bacterium]
MATLVDPIGRKIEYLRVSVVDSCNLHCFYCSPKEACRPRTVRDQLSKEQIIRVIAAAAELGIRKIRLTGGEPLIRKDIVEIVRDVAQINGIEDLSLTTNGTLLAQLAKPLKEAGLKRVNISLDSLDETNFATITHGGDIKTTLTGIDAAVEVGLTPIKINMVVIKDVNDHEIESFARMTLEKDIHVRFIEYMPLLGQEASWKQHFLSSAEIMSYCASVAELEALPEDDAHGPAKNYKFAGAKGILGFITPISQHFCATCNRLRLTSDGKIKPCLFAEDVVDLMPALIAGQNLHPLFLEAVSRKPLHEDISPASLGGVFGPQGMVDIGG